MARNREPVLKRAKALGIEPQYLGINKKSKRQVQQSHAAGACRLRDEVGIGQDVAGRPQQTEDVLADVFEILFGKAHVLLVKCHIFIIQIIDILPYCVSLSQSDRSCQALHLHKRPDGCIL